MYSPVIKNKAISLRKEGHSFAFIAKELNISKSTLSIWLKGVIFTPNRSVLDSIQIGQLQLLNGKRSDKFKSLQEADIYSKDKVKNISASDIFMVGIGIYIGEGSKTANFTRIVNSDPKVIRFMIRWLKECFGVKEDNLKVRIHAYPDNEENITLDFWMKELHLESANFHPLYFDRRLNKKRKTFNSLPYGTAHLTVVSNGEKELGVLLHRKILATIDRILNMRD